MSTKTKKKLCWNCEGETLITATQCPFCGVSLEVVAMENQKSKDPFSPPYKLTSSKDVPASPYTAPSQAEEEPEEKSFSNDPKSLILSVAFLLSGAAFALFGLILWLFADQTGHLNLRWNAEYWFVYLLLSLPLLYLGWKAVQQTQETDKES
jgi:hypothetical protein